MIQQKVMMASEHQEQASFMAWMARFHPSIYDLTYHIPNGRLSAREGSKYKAIGAKSGVPDICIAFPKNPYHGLYIEFKRIDGGSGLSDTQKKWINLLNSNGYKAVVANGWEQATTELEQYLSGW